MLNQNCGNLATISEVKKPVVKKPIPKLLPIIYFNITEELKKINNWICFKVDWNPEKNDGEGGFDKTPINPHKPRTNLTLTPNDVGYLEGLKAKINNPSTWGTFEKSCFAMKKYKYESIGFVFNLKSEIFGVDVDECIVDGKLSEEARFIVDTMNSYTELSPSGTGIHILSFGKLPDYKGSRRRNGDYEMYSTGRGFTITGNVFENFNKIQTRTEEAKIIHDKFLCDPKYSNKRKDKNIKKVIVNDKKIAPKSNPIKIKSLTDNKETSNIIEVENIKSKMFLSKNAEKCKKLFNGDFSEYHSQSEADQAFANILAYYGDNKRVLMDQIFRSSGLYRDKWDRMTGDKTYGQITIEKAIESNFKPGIKNDVSTKNYEINDDLKKFNEILKDTGYTIINNCMNYFKTVKHGDDIDNIPVKMCNFIAWYEEIETIDKSVEYENFYKIVGVREDGKKLPKITINVSEFESLNWLRKWDPKLFIEASPILKNKIRCCIDKISKNSIEIKKYCFTGLKKINEKWCYLYQGGCVGNGLNEDINVDLIDETLLRYQLPELNKKRLIDDVFEVLNLTEVINDDKNIIYALIAITFLAPLREFFKQIKLTPHFVYYLLGTTGKGKSTITSIFLSFFGDFSINESMPMNFTSTKPSFFNYANKLKDILTCIDDYKPDTSNSRRQMDDLAQTIVRAYGDFASRQKCNSKSENIKTKIPQGLAILTGEDVPKVENSGFLRMIILDIKNGVNFEKISKYQEMARTGVFSNVMRGYLEWFKENHLDNNFDETLKNLKETFKSIRTELFNTLKENNSKFPNRIIESLAHLKIGFRMFLNFLEFVVNDKDIKIFTQKIEIEFNEVVLYLSKFNEDFSESEKPTEKFMSIFQALIDSKKIMIQNLDFPEAPQPGQTEVGYHDEEYYYLNPEAIYHEVSKYCIHQGSNFPVTLKTLLKQLCENGMIKLNDDGRFTIRKIIGNSRKRLLWLKKSKQND